MKKVITGLLAALFMMLSLNTVSASINVPQRTSNTTWVEDYANVLDASTEQHIQEYSQRLADDYSACIVVVTVDFVQGSIDQYALSIFNQWKIGDSELNNGILLLLSIGDDDYYMTIGRGLENSFPISDISNLLYDYLEPSFARKDYNTGVRKVFDATYEYVCNIYYTPTPNPNPNPGHRTNYYETLSFIIGLIAIIIAIVIIISILRSVHRNRSYYGPVVVTTRPTYRSRSRYYSAPYSSVYDRSNHHSYPSSSHTYSSPSHSSGGGGYSSSSSHSSSSHSSGSGSSFGGSSRGAGAGRH